METDTELFKLTQSELIEIIKLQNTILNAGTNLEQVFYRITHYAQELTHADGSVIELIEDDKMVYRATSGLVENLIGLRLNMDSSMSGLCAKTGEIQICADSETDDRVDRAACRKVGLRSMIVVPLIYNEKSVGVLKVISKDAGYFSELHSGILLILAELTSLAINNTEKYGNNKLYVASITDLMTGLKNRSFFYDVLRTTFISNKETNKTFTVFILDMDNLKKINDSLGHRSGDLSIIEFTKRVKRVLRDDDVFARLGGDEFGIILNSIKTEEEANQLKDRIIRSVEQPFALDSESVPISGSIGFSICDAETEDIQQLVDCADSRMYEHKKNRKLNRIQ